MILIVIFSSILAISLLLLFQMVGADYLMEGLDYILLSTISLILMFVIALVNQDRIWNRLLSILKPKIDYVSIYISQQLTLLRDALLKGDKNQIQFISSNASSAFSEWYQKYLFKRFLVKSIIGLIIATAGLTTLVLWKKQNQILRGQLSAVSEQIALQRQQWFLNQRTNLMGILYDRKPCEVQPCAHLANLRTRTQAAITLAQVGKVEINSLSNNQNSTGTLRIIQPESLLNLSYVDLSDHQKDRQITPGHGSYLANLDWSSLTLLYANLSYSSLAKTNLSKSKLQYAMLVSTNITNTSFLNGFLMGVDLRNSYGPNVNFSKADLSNANLSGAMLSNANFFGSQLSGAIFIDSDVSGANFKEALGLSCAQLSLAKSKERTQLPKEISCDW
jgi:uncharacterized protein YjbI with pentapeptide repeats